MRTPSFDVKILVEKVRIILGTYGNCPEFELWQLQWDHFSVLLQHDHLLMSINTAWPYLKPTYTYPSWEDIVPLASSWAWTFAASIDPSKTAAFKRGLPKAQATCITTTLE